MAYNPRNDTLKDLGPRGVVGSHDGQLVLYEKDEVSGQARFRKRALKDLLQPQK